MDVLQEIMRIDVAILHQSCQGSAMGVEMGLLDALCLDDVASHQPLDIGAHALVDQGEQPRGCRIQAIVEIEDPVADVSKARVHEPGRA